MKWLFMALLFPLIFSVELQAAVYRECQISIGKTSFCYGPYSGKTSVQSSNEEIKMCTISLGDVTFCDSLYTGKMVLDDNGTFSLCDVSVGKKTFCQGPYTGRAIIKTGK